MRIIEALHRLCRHLVFGRPDNPDMESTVEALVNATEADRIAWDWLSRTMFKNRKFSFYGYDIDGCCDPHLEVSSMRIDIGWHQFKRLQRARNAQNGRRYRNAIDETKKAMEENNHA